MRTPSIRFIAVLTVACVASVSGFTDQFAQAQDAAANTRREPQPQVRYSLGADSLPQEGVPKHKLEGPFLFRSTIIADTVRKYWVSIPAQYDAQQPACVLVFQDGARAINPDGVLRVNTVLDNLIAKKQIPVTIGIYITPGQRGSEFPDSIGTGNPDNRDREYDVLNDNYARMLIEEILPEVGKSYNLTQDPSGRAIGGSSSGGICAFTVAWERPDQFRNVISLIGSFTNIHGGHVYPDLVRQAEPKPIRIFLQDGVNDLRSPDNLDRDWHLQNQKMVAALKDKGYDMAHVFGEGGHSDDHGGAILPSMLRWIWRDFPGISAPTSDLVADAAAVKSQTTELFPGFEKFASVNPSGVYKWERRFGDAAITSVLTVQQQDGALSGTVVTQRGDAPAVSAELRNPVLVGNKLSFDVMTRAREREVLATYHGIISRRGISGWQLIGPAGQGRDTAWNATREISSGLLNATNEPASWQFELNGDGKGSMEIAGDAVVFTTTQVSSENWHVQAYQPGLDLKEGQEYELSFSAKSPTGVSVLVMGIINQSDWHGIGLQEEVYIGQTEREYSVTFTARDVLAQNNRIGFVLGGSTGTVEIRDMSLVER